MCWVDILRATSAFGGGCCGLVRANAIKRVRPHGRQACSYRGRHGFRVRLRGWIRVWHRPNLFPGHSLPHRGYATGGGISGSIRGAYNVRATNEDIWHSSELLHLSLPFKCCRLFTEFHGRSAIDGPAVKPHGLAGRGWVNAQCLHIELIHKRNCERRDRARRDQRRHQRFCLESDGRHY